MNSKNPYNLVIACTNVGNEVANPGVRPLHTPIGQTPASSPMLLSASELDQALEEIIERFNNADQQKEASCIEKQREKEKDTAEAVWKRGARREGKRGACMVTTHGKRRVQEKKG